MLPPALGGLRFRVPPVPDRRAPGSMSKINQRLSCRRKLGMPLALSFKKSVKELSKCLVLRGYRILDCPQFLCRFSLHCRLLSFQVGCIFLVGPVQPVLLSFVLDVLIIPYPRYAVLRTLADVATRPWRTPRFACRRSRAVERPGVWKRSSSTSRRFCPPLNRTGEL